MVHKSLVSIALMALILGCASDSDSDVKPSEGDASVAQDAGSVPDAARQTTDSDMPNDGSVMQMDGQISQTRLLNHLSQSAIQTHRRHSRTRSARLANVAIYWSCLNW